MLQARRRDPDVLVWLVSEDGLDAIDKAELPRHPPGSHLNLARQVPGWLADGLRGDTALAVERVPRGAGRPVALHYRGETWRPGDWLVCEHDGHVYGIARWAFTKHYRLAPASGPC